MKILVDHGAGYNLGDIAMLEGAISRLANILPHAKISVINRSGLQTNIWNLPNVFKENNREIKIPALNFLEKSPFFWRYHNYWRNSILKLAILLRNVGIKIENKSELKEFCSAYDALIITGGGYLASTFISQLVSKSCLIQTFSAQNKPIILTGQQIGPFNSRFSKKFLLKTLSKVNFLGLRDPGNSLEFSKEIDIDKQRIKIMGDDSFGLDSVDEIRILDILNEIGLKPYKFIAVNVRIGPYNKKIKKNLTKLNALFKKLGEILNMSILFIPISLNKNDNDLTSGEKLTKNTNYPYIKVFALSAPTPALIKGVISKAYGAIGVSYHFCTFALTEAIPAICICNGDYYAQKANGLSLFWQDNRIALPIDEINNIDCAAEYIVKIFSDELLREKIKLRSIEAREEWRKIFDEQIIKEFKEYKDK